jgi:hypothetical protein
LIKTIKYKLTNLIARSFVLALISKNDGQKILIGLEIGQSINRYYNPNGHLPSKVQLPHVHAVVTCVKNYNTCINIYCMSTAEVHYDPLSVDTLANFKTN